jgi:hypothetical protein
MKLLLLFCCLAASQAASDATAADMYSHMVQGEPVFVTREGVSVTATVIRESASFPGKYYLLFADGQHKSYYLGQIKVAGIDELMGVAGVDEEKADLAVAQANAHNTKRTREWENTKEVVGSVAKKCTAGSGLGVANCAAAAAAVCTDNALSVSGSCNMAEVTAAGTADMESGGLSGGEELLRNFDSHFDYNSAEDKKVIAAMRAWPPTGTTVDPKLTLEPFDGPYSATDCLASNSDYTKGKPYPETGKDAFLQF